jgi:hypothetical protein
VFYCLGYGQPVQRSPRANCAALIFFTSLSLGEFSARPACKVPQVTILASGR